MLGSDGALYGTTYRGGSNGLDTQYQGYGTVFRLNKDGSGYEILHHFGSVPDDGERPWCPIVEASDGMLYGTTVYGGGTNMNGDSYGTIFRMNKEGTDYTVLYRLNGTSDGKWPIAQVIEASNGILYGTTEYGGPSDLYYGTVFALDKNGNNFRVLHSFGPNPGVDGLLPGGPLFEASDGALYGTTIIAGNAGGTVFKINKDGSGYVILHRFDSQSQIALNPYAQLTQGSDGALYGTL
jgi:uncharacterized repeat protein (TIGR03803 family)